MRSSRSDDISNPTDLAHTSVLLDVSGTSPAMPSRVQAGDTPLLLPASGIEPTAESVQLTCDAEDTTSVANSSPIQEGIVHPGESMEVKVPKTSKTTKCPKKKTAVKKKEKIVKFDLSDIHCYPKCKVSKPTDMIRCSLCMTWIHVECTGEDTNYQGVWCCHLCRTLPKSIQGMTEQIQRLISSIESIQNSEAALQAEVQNLKAENGKLRSKLNHSELHNSELAKLIETMSFPTSSQPGSSIQDDKLPLPNPSSLSQRHLTPPVRWRHLPVPASTKTLQWQSSAVRLSVVWHHLSTGKVLTRTAVSFQAALPIESTPESGISRWLTSQSWRQERTISRPKLLKSVRKKSSKPLTMLRTRDNKNG